MQFVCAQLDTATQTCIAWAEQTPFLPELTKADADAYILWWLGIMLTVFTVRQLRRLFT